MKNIFLLALAICCFCSFQDWRPIRGNGIIKTEVRETGSFESLAVGGPYDVHLEYGDTKGIEITAEENLLPYIVTSVEHGQLDIKIKRFYSLHPQKAIVIKLAMRSLIDLSMSGSGELHAKGPFVNNGKSEIKVSGSGNMYYDFSSIGDADIKVSGSGNLVMRGAVKDKVDIKVSGSGNGDCSNLSASSAVVRVSGSGDVKLKADKELDVHISGSGNVSYAGNARVNSHIRGSGSIRKI
ncbi:MAG: hypothetical protein JWN76_842 [Chitinophagaceae bacterium]|nr:hypothetical protein [Chitinophagaceae bacterium]